MGAVVFILGACSGARDGSSDPTGAEQPTPVAGAEPEAPSSCLGLRLNELNPSGSPDWVELYNPSAGVISLAGCYLSDDPSEPLKASLEPLEVPAEGFVLIEVSDETLGFKLGKSEAVILSSVEGQLVDSVEYTEEQFMGAETLGRVPDGLGDWAPLEIGSPGEPNVIAATPSGGAEPQEAGAEPQEAGAEPQEAGAEPQTGGVSPELGRLVINEVAAKGDPTDWVELLYLAPEGSAPLELSAYSLSDQEDSSLASALMGEINPQERLVIEVSDETLGFKLGSDEAVYLWDMSGTLVDSVDWEEGASPEGGSLSRIPDGTGGFMTTVAHSRGAENL